MLFPLTGHGTREKHYSPTQQMRHWGLRGYGGPYEGTLCDAPQTHVCWLQKPGLFVFFSPFSPESRFPTVNFSITDGTICFLKSIQQWRAVVLGSGMGVMPIPAARLHRKVQWRCLMCQPGSQGGLGPRSTSGTNCAGLAKPLNLTGSLFSKYELHIRMPGPWTSQGACKRCYQCRWTDCENCKVLHS